MQLRIGVVGCGLVAQAVHLPWLAADGRAEVTALADPSRAVRTALAARYGVRRTHADHRRLLEEPLDAVVVCSPNGTHAAVVTDALDAGLDVFVEKPLCLTVADAERIAADAARRGRVVQVGYMKRFTEAYERLADELVAAAPELVRIDSVTVDPGLADRLAPHGLVRATDVPRAVAARLEATTAEQVAEQLGTDRPDHVRMYSDAFLGALVHDVNLVHGLGVAGVGVLDAFGGPELAGGTVALPGGGRWSLTWMLLPGAGPFREELRLYARDRVWTLAHPAPYLRNAPVTWSAESALGRGWEQRSGGGYRDAYDAELDHFVACVADGRACRTPPRDAVADIALLARLAAAAVGSAVPA
jgi:predicted dehydrogenase